MPIGPIFRALMRNKTGTFLLVVQIALTLAVLMNAVALMIRSNELISQDTGVEQTNLVMLRHAAFDAAYDQPSYREARLKEDLDVLRRIEGVVSVAAANGAPSVNTWSEIMSVPGTEERLIEHLASTYHSSDQFLIAIGVALAEGRNFRPEEVSFNENGIKQAASNSVIISKTLGDRLYPDGNALGQQIEVAGELKTIIGLTESFEATIPYFAFFGIPVDAFALYPSHYDSTFIQFLVRVEDGRAAELKTTIASKLLEADSGRELTDIRTLEEARTSMTGLLEYANLVLGAISGLLVLVTGLGIFGLASFSVAKRRKQIGTRRALGASQLGIVLHFLTENMLITLGGIVLGLLLGLGLNFVLTTLGLTRISAIAVAGCIAFIAILGALAVLAPALQAARVSPAVATRTV